VTVGKLIELLEDLNPDMPIHIDGKRLTGIWIKSGEKGVRIVALSYGQGGGCD